MDQLTSGPGSVILPLAVAGASMAAPRIGSGLTAGLGVLDWAQRNNKLNEHKAAFGALPKYFGGVEQPTTSDLTGGEGGQAQTPPPTGQAPSKPDMNSALDAALKDPAVLKDPTAVATIMQYKMHLATQEPKKQIMQNDDGSYSVVSVPAMGGSPSTQAIPGVRAPQKFAQDLEDTLFSAYGKGPYTPEQTAQGQGLLQQKTEDREARQLNRSFALQNQSNENYFSRMERSQKNLQDSALLTAGRSDFRLLNNHLNTDLTNINKEAAKARAGLYSGGQPMLPGNKLQAELGRIDQQKNEATRSVHEGYITQWGDLQTQYPFLQDMKGGTPEYVQKQLDSANSLGNVTDAAIVSKLSPVDANSFQKAMKSNADNPAAQKQIRQKALLMMRQ